MHEDDAPFDLVSVDEVVVEGPRDLLAQDLMSPFVWRLRDGGGLGVLLRSVPRPMTARDVTGRIWNGRCNEGGIRFLMDEEPLIRPGPGDLDVGGCEDPTVVPTNRDCVVYYTGVDGDGDAQMLYAEGRDIHSLKKSGVALASSRTERNTKEASVDRTADGQWRLFYEYASDGRSRIGSAWGPGPHGPWEERDDPFVARQGSWDAWHLSTGPLLMSREHPPIMFYNGSDRDAHWAIGWVVLDTECIDVVARSERPLIVPSPAGPDGAEISFASSAIEVGSEIWLYFSRNDRRPFRARLKRRLR